MLRRYVSSIAGRLRYAEAGKLREWPMFRVLDADGGVESGAEKYEHGLSDDQKRKVYRTMVMTSFMDQVFYSAQRQGRISFYMTCAGEEAAVVASAAALRADDEVFAQYREQGVLMWRGFRLDQIASQLFSSEREPARGRQMPIHYGSKELHFHTISSTLATQIPHAVGAAYSMKMGRENRIAVTYFGDGAASEGDFHAALNFASTLDCPVLFLCRNNGYAISTPTHEQFRGDGIARRGAAYGIDALRVDGNDVLAVHGAVADGRERVVSSHRPVLVEMMTYRRGHHSTSDDSTRYRDNAEVQHYKERGCPIQRFRGHLRHTGLWTDSEEEQLKEECLAEVMSALEVAEKENKPPPLDVFEDVYDNLPRSLHDQRESLRRHLSEHKDKY